MEKIEKIDFGQQVANIREWRPITIDDISQEFFDSIKDHFLPKPKKKETKEAQTGTESPDFSCHDVNSTQFMEICQKDTEKTEISTQTESTSKSVKLRPSSNYFEIFQTPNPQIPVNIPENYQQKLQEKQKIKENNAIKLRQKNSSGATTTTLTNNDSGLPKEENSILLENSIDASKNDSCDFKSISEVSEKPTVGGNQLSNRTSVSPNKRSTILPPVSDENYISEEPQVKQAKFRSSSSNQSNGNFQTKLSQHSPVRSPEKIPDGVENRDNNDRNSNSGTCSGNLCRRCSEEISEKNEGILLDLREKEEEENDDDTAKQKNDEDSNSEEIEIDSCIFLGV